MASKEWNQWCRHIKFWNQVFYQMLLIWILRLKQENFFTLDRRKGKLHFANINVTFISLFKKFCQKFVFSSKDSCNASSIVPCFSIARIWHTPTHDVWSFHGFKFAAINASSHLNLLYPKGFEVRMKSLERHFYEKITSRAGSKHGPCLMNNITNIFVVLDLIVLHNGNNLLKINDRFGANF